MLGFATLDANPRCDTSAVWLTSRVAPDLAEHTNAVSIQDSDASSERTMRALIADRILLLTPGSQAPSFAAGALTVDDLSVFRDEIEHLQERIISAITEHSTRARNGNLVRPVFARFPRPEEFDMSSESPTKRALETANFLAKLWTCWLSTEEQRRRRSINPKTGTTPWIMPEEMNAQTIAELPPVFAERVLPEVATKC